VVVDGHLRYPPPPEPVSLAAHLLIEVDADGYGHVSATDVELGTITYDLGWPFGIVTVQLETMRVAGTVWVTPVIPGDIDDDCDVDLHDLATLLASYGLCEGDPAYDPAADLNDSGCVDLVDLALLLVNYGLGM
ncbi:MAG: hypothetical protein ACE5I3_11295, partial [Phycisphaerae bacterium]